MLLDDVFKQDLIKMDLQSETKEECFEEMAAGIASVYGDLEGERIVSALNDREIKMNTAIMSGAAIPHGCLTELHSPIGAIGFSRRGIDYEAPDRMPVHVVFMLLLGGSSREKHLNILSRLLNLFQSEDFEGIKRAASPGEIQDILRRY